MAEDRVVLLQGVVIALARYVRLGCVRASRSFWV